jgi:LDH2 family malate/lactate/ureidoglycolate dehydrogenase
MLVLEMVAPHGSYEPIFGTNPLAIGVPRSIPADLPSIGQASGSASGDSVDALLSPVVLDMATSAYAWYGIKSAAENNESIPGDVAWDANGNATTDPAAALGGALRSFDRSYKGSHLGLMVELLAGALTGAAMNDKKASGNWGTTVVVLHPNVLGDQDGFVQRVQDMCTRVHGAKPLPDAAGKPHYLPGERGDLVTERNMQAGSLEVPAEVYAKLLVMNK